MTSVATTSQLARKPRGVAAGRMVAPEMPAFAISLDRLHSLA